MEQKIKHVANSLIDFVGKKFNHGIQKIEKKVDDYKDLRGLESDFVDFGIKSYEYLIKNNNVPNELADDFAKLKQSIDKFENS